MKNSLSHIYYALEHALGEERSSWGEGVQVVESRQYGKDRLWWLRADKANEVLTDEQIDELSTGGYLANGGGARKAKFGKTSELAYCVFADKLREAVRSKESTIATATAERSRVRQLESELKAAREHNAASEAMARIIRDVAKVFKFKPGAVAVPFKRQKPAKFNAEVSVPTLLLSDWHYGEVVDGNQIQQMNDYNVAIAKERMERVFRTTLEILFHHHSGVSYDGFVMAFGGDMLSGLIREELRQTNEKAVSDCLAELVQLTSQAIMDFADNFPGVYVPCVPGNHGRFDPLPKAKNAHKDNWDTVFYQFVEMLVRAKMGSKCNVQFDIRGRDLTYKLYDTKFLLTHGDCGKGASTDAQEFWPAALRSAERRQRRAEYGVATTFDYQVTGHFHKYGAVGNVICNGSLKGYDEHGFNSHMPYERPIQALWITSPEQGITSHVRVYGDEGRPEVIASLAPITTAGYLESLAVAAA